MAGKYCVTDRNVRKENPVLKSILVFGIGAGIGFSYGVLKEHKRMLPIVEEKIKKGDKFQNFYYMMLSWIRMHQKRRTFDDYFSWHGIRRIAVYGNGAVGQIFVKEMEGLETELSYIIDKKADTMRSKVPVFTLQQDCQRVDAIVVTVLERFDEIAEEIQREYDYPIVPLDEVVYGSTLY